MFIPVDKMKQLREAAKSGDERARKILRAQLDGSDYASDLEAYFSHVPAPSSTPGGQFSMPATEQGQMPEHVSTGNAQLDEWLRSNNIHDTDEDYEDALEEYYAEYPDQRPAKEPEPVAEQVAPAAEEEIDATKEIAQGIIDVISKCDQTSLSLMQNEEIDATAKKGAMTIIQEIKTSLLDAADKLTKIKQTLSKKQEKELEADENGLVQ